MSRPRRAGGPGDRSRRAGDVVRTPLAACPGPGRIRGCGREGRARLCAQRVLLGRSSPPGPPPGAVGIGVTSCLSQIGLGRRRKTASFSAFALAKIPFFPTSHSSSGSEGMKVPVAAADCLGRDVVRHCGWQRGTLEWLGFAALASRCRALISEAGKVAPGSPRV